MKYTEDDVIWRDNDPRLKDLKEGDLIWTSENYRWLLTIANKNGEPHEFISVDTDCDNTFVFKATYGINAAPFIIIKKKDDASSKQTKRVPFDFSKKEDRDALRGRWVNFIYSNTEFIIDRFYDYNCEHLCSQGHTAQEMFQFYVFLDGPDAGQPVGKVVEEEE